MHIVQDPEIQRLYRAYESSISMDLHCADEGQWSAEQINQDPAIKAAKVMATTNAKASLRLFLLFYPFTIGENVVYGTSDWRLIASHFLL
jgi:hypothetical protein